MISSIKESLQNAISNLSEEDCVQVMEFVQDLQHKNASDKHFYASDEDLFEYLNGVLIVKSALDEGVEARDIELAVKQDREAQARKIDA